VLTLEGEHLTLGADSLDAPGFDLLALFTGSEGLLGIITEVTVKLLPKPQVAKVLLASFDSVEKAGHAVAEIIAAGIIPGGLEMMDNLAIRAAEDFIHAGYPVDAEAILLCELDGVEADVHDDCERVREVLQQAGASDVRQARDKINQMCAQFNSDELTLFHAVKAAFDPKGLLNPGKNIPTLHRCAEFGAMHIHAGQLPFPELERF
jgi:glycolate oxidase